MLMLLTLLVLILATVALVAVGIAALLWGNQAAAGGASGAKPVQDGEVISTVAKLVEDNQRMQEQLVSAEELLHTQARQIESRAVEARTDPLTQIANRRAFDDALAERIEEMQSRGQALSVMLLDVDSFKKLNDTFGSQAGDEVLRQVARILRQQVADANLVARFGGEEFAILFPFAMPSARAAAELARGAISASKVRFEARDLRVTASAGIAEMQSGEDQESLLQRADAALQSAKDAGRNCLFWCDGLKSHRMQKELLSFAKTPARDDLSDLLGTQWTADEEALPPAVSSATEVYVSSKPAFVDDMVRRLAQWKRDHTPLCLMLVQIDGFAAGIQKHGEEAAGLVLRIVAQILKANMRDMDHVSRLGSDTFALLLPAAHLEDGAHLAERLRQAASQCRLPAKAKGLTLNLTMGVVETHTGDDMRRLLQRGRNALQVALDKGQGVYAQDVNGSLDKSHLAAYA
jgi:diguanylate cyclase